MIQLQILSGKKAGSDIAVRHFPFCIGRHAEAGLQLNEDGIWERHLEITFERGAGFILKSRQEASILINGERVEEGSLRNGDLIELGSVQIRFWLARSPQQTMRVQETLTWAALALLFAVQIGLIYSLLR